MKQGSSRRHRNRGSSNGNHSNNGSRKNTPLKYQNFESNGPEGKVRGTPVQVHDKYVAMARDALSAGDHVKAEAFYQFAEHYARLVNEDRLNNPAPKPQEQTQAASSEASGEEDSAQQVVEDLVPTSGSSSEAQASAA